MADTETSSTQKPTEETIAGYALGDQATSIDSLGFTPYVEAIARFLTSPATRPPISLTIEGEWGSGKSSFLLQLERAICGERRDVPWDKRLPIWLGGEKSPPAPARKRELSVRFNAWRHDKQDQLWAAFALAFVKSLRAEVGMVRAWRGDIVLFLSRLKGPAGWLELILLVASIAGVLIGVLALRSFVANNHSQATAMLDWLLKADLKPEAGAKLAKEVPGADAIRLLSSGGAFGTMTALGVAGLLKFHEKLKAPISLNLAKYIAKPDYEGHTAFVETFHADLNRLIEAYVGERRVFIFIDDLDRCDVPRAADLMQAINLMIGDSKNLVFIMGMDREKVAAGIAQKYKDMLPFLRDTAKWRPNSDADPYVPLYFGYAYLEKFIQIGFTLPVATSKSALHSFFTVEPAPVRELNWIDRVRAYWSANRDPAERADQTAATGGAEDAGASQDTQDQQQQQAARVYNRLRIERDSDGIQRIVGQVSCVFEHNPRRIKQFINTFRLTLFIASDQGLFDKEADQAPAATPEQIGKFVALLLRFPDLRFALEEDSALLGKLEREALKNANERNRTYHWLWKPGAIELLSTGCMPPEPSPIFSLIDLNVDRLFSVLPRSIKPEQRPEPAITAIEARSAPYRSETAILSLEQSALEYEAIRARLPSGGERTRQMNALALAAMRFAAELKDPEAGVDHFGADDRPGWRLMRILIAFSHHNPGDLSWLLDYNRDFTTPFEHYWCLRTLTDLSPQMTVTQRRRMASDLAARWTEISGDPGRVDLASALREWPESDTSVAMGARARRRATTRPAQSSQASEEGQTAADTGRPPSPPNPTETGRPRTTQSTLGGKMPSVAKEVTSVEKSVGEVRAQTKSRRSKK